MYFSIRYRTVPFCYHSPCRATAYLNQEGRASGTQEEVKRILGLALVARWSRRRGGEGTRKIAGNTCIAHVNFVSIIYEYRSRLLGVQHNYVRGLLVNHHAVLHSMQKVVSQAQVLAVSSAPCTLLYPFLPANKQPNATADLPLQVRYGMTRSRAQ